MYRISYEYKNGHKGTCIEDGKTLTFDSKKEADAYAEKLNGAVSEEVKEFFPVWYAEEVEK